MTLNPGKIAVFRNTLTAMFPLIILLRNKNLKNKTIQNKSIKNKPKWQNLKLALPAPTNLNRLNSRKRILKSKVKVLKNPRNKVIKTLRTEKILARNASRRLQRLRLVQVMKKKKRMTA